MCFGVLWLALVRLLWFVCFGFFALFCLLCFIRLFFGCVVVGVVVGVVVLEVHSTMCLVTN